MRIGPGPRFRTPDYPIARVPVLAVAVLPPCYLGRSAPRESRRFTNERCGGQARKTHKAIGRGTEIERPCRLPLECRDPGIWLQNHPEGVARLSAAVSAARRDSSWRRRADVSRTILSSLSPLSARRRRQDHPRSDGPILPFVGLLWSIGASPRR